MLIKKNVLLILILAIYSNPIFAALPPYFQTAKEITSILNNTTIAKTFGSGKPVSSIIRTEDGYIVSTTTCKLIVRVHYRPNSSGMVGPALYDVIPDLSTYECNH